MSTARYLLATALYTVFLTPQFGVAQIPIPRQPAVKAHLTIEVVGFADTTGTAAIGLLDNEKTFKLADMRKERQDTQRYFKAIADQPIQRTGQYATATCRVENLTPGEYTAFTFHDRNRNGKLDSNVIGFPLEPFGMSNDIRPQLFPIPKSPTWKEAAFIIQPGENRIRITIQN